MRWPHGRLHFSPLTSTRSSALAERGIPLIYREVDDFAASVDTVAAVCAEEKVSHLFYNYQYEVNERQRDAAVEKALVDVACQGFDDSVMLAPGSVVTGNHEMYKVFTPYKNAFLRRLKDELPACVGAPDVRTGGALDGALATLTFDYPQEEFDSTLFAVDEKTAIQRLRAFCQQHAAAYEQQRDFPAIEGTSRLSACLALGVLSARQCLHRLLAEQPDALNGGAGSVWLNELIWREFIAI